MQGCLTDRDNCEKRPRVDGVHMGRELTVTVISPLVVIHLPLKLVDTHEESARLTLNIRKISTREFLQTHLMFEWRVSEP